MSLTSDAVPRWASPRRWRLTLLAVLVLLLPAGELSRMDAQERASENASAPKTPGDAAEEESDREAFEFRLSVVGPEGEPVPRARIEIRTNPRPTAEQFRWGTLVEKSNSGVRAEADERGVLAVEMPQRPRQWTINIQQPGYGPYWAQWDSTRNEGRIPREFTAELEAGWSVGGVVVDEAGEPVAGAAVRPRVEYKKKPGDRQQLGVGTRIVTDAEGRWRFDCIPGSMSEVSVAFDHRDFQPLRRSLARQAFEIQAGAEPTQRIELNVGLTVRGRVTDEAGEPVRNALVRTKALNETREARTDEQGNYVLTGCEPRMSRIVVSAKGRATDMQELQIAAEMEPVNFWLPPGRKVRVRVLDEDGKGIARARIFFQGWREGQFQYFEFDHVSQYANQDGVWEWNEAPLDAFQADICRPGGMQLSKRTLHARDEEFVFRPPVALVVSGAIVDAETKAPIKKFRVVPGLRNSDSRIGANWITGDSFDGADGAYRVRLTHDYPAHLVRIEAAGYRVAVSRDIMTDEGEVTFDFELQPASDIAATILTPQGEPAAKAKVAIGVAGEQISIQRGDIDDTSTYATRIDADADGRFSFPALEAEYQLVVTHPSGFAHLHAEEGRIPEQITLTAWARVAGTFREGKNLGRGVTLNLIGGGIQTFGQGGPNIFTHHEVTTGDDGQFVLERVFPGSSRIGRRILLIVDQGATEVTSAAQMPVLFKSGETTTIELGGNGRPVIGQLVPRGDEEAKVPWNFAVVNVQADLQAPPAPVPPPDVQNDADRLAVWRATWQATPAGLAWLAAYQVHQQLVAQQPYFTATVASDGTFRIEDMPGGDYVLSVYFSNRAQGGLRNHRFHVPFTEPGSDEPLSLGKLHLQ